MMPFFSEQRDCWTPLVLSTFRGKSLIFPAPQYDREDADLRARHYPTNLGSELHTSPFELGSACYRRNRYADRLADRYLSARSWARIQVACMGISAETDRGD